MPEDTDKTSEQLEKEAENLLSLAVKEVEELDTEIPVPLSPLYEVAKEDVNPALRFTPFVRTSVDPETLSTAEKARIVPGTILFREGTTPRRIYFKTPSALYRLVANGSTDSGGAVPHTHIQ